LAASFMPFRKLKSRAMIIVMMTIESIFAD
jgi:hypothetical protein